MKSLSGIFFFILFFFSVATPLFLPLPVTAAGLVPCGRSADDPATTIDESKPCTVCHLIIGGKGVIDYGLQIMTYVAIAVIVAMAIFYIVSTGNEGMMQTAKSGIKAALIGFAVMLAAWLIVNTTLRILSATIPGLGIMSSGFTFSCDTSSSAGTAVGVGAGTGILVGAMSPAPSSPISVTFSASAPVDVTIPEGGATVIMLDGNIDYSLGPVELIETGPITDAAKKSTFAFFKVSTVFSASSNLVITPDKIDTAGQAIIISVKDGISQGSTDTVTIKQNGNTLGTVNVAVTASAAAATTINVTYTRSDYVTGAGPYGITFDPSTNSIWTANLGANKATKLNASTGATLGTYYTDAGPTGITFDSSTNSIWTANLGANNVTKLNASTGATLGIYTVGTHPYNVTFDSSTNSVWAANYGSGNVTKLNASSGALVGTYAVTHAYDIVFDSFTNSIWVTRTDSNNVTKLNASTGATLGTYTVGTNPKGITFDPSTNSIWVVNSNSSNVTKLNASTGATVGTYAVGSFPQDVTFDSSTNSVWIANNSSSNVTKLNASTGATLGTYTVGTSPMGITFDSSTSSIWVTNSNSNVTKLSPSSSISPSSTPTSTITTSAPDPANADPLVLHTWTWSSTNGATYKASAIITLCSNSNYNGATPNWTPWTDTGHSATATQASGSVTSVYPGTERYGCKFDVTYVVTNTTGQISTATATLKFKNAPVPAPTINSFTVSPNPVPSGGTLTFNWSSNAASCTLAASTGFSPMPPNVMTDGPATGSATYSPSQAMTYTLTCKNSAGTGASQSVYVEVTEPSVASLSISPSSGTFNIALSNPATLVFTLSGATRGDLEACYEVIAHSNPGVVLTPGACNDSANFFTFDGNAEWHWVGSNLVGTFHYDASIWGATGIQTKAVFRKKSAPTVQANSVIMTTGTIATSNSNSNVCNPPAVMTSSEKIDWFCNLPENEGPNCVVNATSLLPYISDYAKYPGLDVRGCTIDTSLPCGGFGPCY